MGQLSKSLHKEPKHYYPRTGFSYNFDNIEKEKGRKYLVSRIEDNKRSIKKELDKLFKQKCDDLSGTKKNTIHNTIENQRKFPESFLNHSVKYITQLSDQEAGNPHPAKSIKGFLKELQATCSTSTSLNLAPQNFLEFWSKTRLEHRNG